MLARAVDTGKGLFMKKTHKIMSQCDALHNLHRQLIVVRRQIDAREHGRKLVLCRRDLVMLGLRENTELPELLVKLLHICRDARFYRAEIVIVHLLPFGRLCTEERAAGKDEVFSFFIKLPINEKIFLLRADGDVDALCRRVPEKAHYSHRLFVYDLDRAKKRSFFIERLAAVGIKGTGNAERSVLYECIARRIPRGVASRLKSCAKAAGGKTRSVRLALD